MQYNHHPLDMPAFQLLEYEVNTISCMSLNYVYSLFLALMIEEKKVLKTKH